MSPAKPRTGRSVEARVDIAAPVEAVWNALTKAEELTRWFPLDARVSPGKGGSIWISWGPPFEGASTIEIWEPNRRLKLTQGQESTEPQKEAVPLSIDYVLEGRGGTTTLRLVQSGFGEGSEWDDQYDGTRRGWQFELRSLAHYLEHHRGTPRRVGWSRRAVAVSREQAWERLTGPEGLRPDGSLAALRDGDAYRLRAGGGGLFEGRVVVCDSPHQFAGTVRGFNDALLRIAVEKCGPQLEAWLWLGTYGIPQAKAEQTGGSFEAMLRKLFPESSAAGA